MGAQQQLEKYNLGQYNGFEMGAPHAAQTDSVPAFERCGKSVTSLMRAHCLLQQVSSAKTTEFSSVAKTSVIC